MPRFDGKGPRGEGPRTGRGLGNCSDSKINDSKTTRPRMGLGQGQGQGRRSGNRGN